MSDAVAVPVAPAAGAPSMTTIAHNAPPPEPEKTETPPPAAEASPVTEEPKATEPEAPKVEAKEFLALKREKAKLFEAEKAIKQRSQQAEQTMKQAEQVKASLAPVQQAIESFDDNPTAVWEMVAKARGKSIQEVFDASVVALTKLGDPPDPNDRVSKLERKLAEKEAAEQKARDEQEAKQVEAAEAAMRADVSQRLGTFFAAEAERYESILLRGEKAHNDLMDLAQAWHDKHGEPLGVVQAADLLEAQYLAEDEELLTNRLKKSRKLSKHFTPEPSAPVPAQAPAQPTNAAPASPPAAGDQTNPPSSPRLITARRAVVPAGSKVVRRASSDEELVERLGKSVRFT